MAQVSFAEALALILKGKTCAYCAVPTSKKIVTHARQKVRPNQKPANVPRGTGTKPRPASNHFPRIKESVIKTPL